MKSVAEKQNFELHPAILFSLINNQASGVEKALLELVMNSVDAGATRIDVHLNTTGFEVRDNGKGFKDMQEIESCFGEVGLPHENDAYYGRFRMGRLQSFGYAKTLWKTNNMEMEVDLNVDRMSEDYGYSTRYVDDITPGCHIIGQFYQQHPQCEPLRNILPLPKLRPEDCSNPIIALALSVKYLPVDVYINHQKVNIDQEKALLHSETENAKYYIETTLSMSSNHYSGSHEVNVYNKGVYAYSISSRHFVGDIVTTKAIQLNMARNEAKYGCPVNTEIARHLGKLDQLESIERQRKHKSFIDSLSSDHLQFRDGFWQSLIGINNKGFKDTHEFIATMSVRWFKSHRDTNLCFKDFSEHFMNQHTLKPTALFLVDSDYPEDVQSLIARSPNLNLYSRDELLKKASFPSQIDWIDHNLNYVPIEIFPDAALMQNLKGQVISFKWWLLEDLANLTPGYKLSEGLAVEVAIPYDAKNEELHKYFLMLLIKAHVFLSGLKHLYQTFAKLGTRFNVPELAVTSIRDFEYKIENCPLHKSMLIFYDNYSFGSERNFYFYMLNFYSSLMFTLDHSRILLKSPGSVDYQQVELIDKRFQNEHKFQLNTVEEMVLDFLKDLTNVTNGFESLTGRRYTVLGRRLYLGDLEDGVMGCTDSLNYIIISGNHFKSLVAEMEIEKLLYLIYHELAHSEVENTSFHGEMFYSEFHSFSLSMKRDLRKICDGLRELLFKKNNLSDPDRLIELGFTAPMVDYLVASKLSFTN